MRLKPSPLLPFFSCMNPSGVTAMASLPDSLLLQVAQVRMAKKQMDAEGQAALQLIASVTPMNVDSGVGRNLNIVA